MVQKSVLCVYLNGLKGCLVQKFCLFPIKGRCEASLRLRDDSEVSRRVCFCTSMRG